MRRIKKIVTSTGQGVKSYSLGDVVNGLEIVKIKDESVEFPDNIYFLYRCYDKENKIVVDMVNAPMVIEFEDSPIEE